MPNVRLVNYAIRMADEDFGIESLAEYLHLDPAQVAKLVERGRLPGRRVAGQWRFSSSAIHHWLEQKIGLSDSDELASLEDVLRTPTVASPDAPLSFLEMLPVEAIAVPLAARTRTSVMASMTELAAATGWLWDPQQMAEAVRTREDMSPTALETGVALLHPRRPQASILGQAFIALGITDQGIPFGGSRGTLTDVFFLICSIDDRGHLQTLTRLSRLLSQEGFLSELRAAPDAISIRELIAKAEKKLEL